MPVRIVSTDLTKIACDAIVNPTDPYYSAGGGVDRAVRLAAGAELTEYLRNAPALAVSDIYETPGFNLPCKHVLHTVGPVWNFGRSGETAALIKCYENALTTAMSAGDECVAFPLISSGTNGFPKDRVMAIARETITKFLSDRDWDPEIILSVPDKNDYFCPEERELSFYLEERGRMKYAAAKAKSCRFEKPIEPDAICCNTAFSVKERLEGESLGDWLKDLDDTFAVTLLKLIDKKGMTDVQCYKKANVSRKTFFKIRNEKDYRPSKYTVIAFAIALELDLDETNDLMKTVGFTFSGSSRFDRIIEFCIVNRIYDVFKINDMLFSYDQPTLGC